MKKYFLLLILIFAGCEENDRGELNRMTFTLYDAGQVWMSLAGSGQITVDFGDGSPAFTYMLGNMATEISYVYQTDLHRTITIIGENISFLNCSNNRLTGVDVSENNLLVYLCCSQNRLINLDVSKNTFLTNLECNSNQLTSLDVGKNILLSGLICSNNQLTNLDVSKNTLLSGLICNFNELKELDMSKNTVLSALWCSNNQLSAIALDNIFNAIPSRQNGVAELSIIGNPGSDMCDRDIALNKGWIFTDR